MQFWEEGPDLPIAMDYGCAVSISSTTFLIISKRDVREFDAAFDAGKPTSNSNWKDSATWPQLQTERWYHPGCAVIGKTLVIAGGFRSPVSTGTTAGTAGTTGTTTIGIGRILREVTAGSSRSTGTTGSGLEATLPSTIGSSGSTTTATSKGETAYLKKMSAGTGSLSQP